MDLNFAAREYLGHFLSNQTSADFALQVVGPWERGKRPSPSIHQPANIKRHRELVLGRHANLVRQGVLVTLHTGCGSGLL